MKRKFDWLLLILLGLVILLRLPSLFEPYWYADEGIYLTIGQALNKGLVLYTDIFDHKPPLIYLLASWLNNILAWKMLGCVMAIVGATFFYKVARILLENKWLAGMSSLLWVVMFNLPILEGNIVNAEVLFMPLVLVGAYCWLRAGVLKKTDTALISARQRIVLCVVAGILWGLSLLVKSQAMLEVLVWVLPLVFFNMKELKKRLPYILGVLGGGIAVGVVTLVWAVVNHNLVAMIDGALMYSLEYSAYASFFSLKTAGLILMALLAFLWWQNKNISVEVKIMLLWLFCSTVGTMMSGRPYAHYWLQLVASVAMGIMMIMRQLTKGKNGLKMAGLILIPMVVMVLGSARILKGQELQAEMARKVVVDYYGNFVKYLAKQQNIFAWYASLNGLVKDNYAIAPLIMNDENPYLLVWGNNPSLYAQTNKLPTSEFVVDYHLYDRVEKEETLNVWLTGLIKKAPTFVVVMNNDDGSEKGRDWEGFYAYLLARYEKIYQGEQLELWQLL